MLDEPGKRVPVCASAPLLWSLLPLAAGIVAAKGGILAPLTVCLAAAACLRRSPSLSAVAVASLAAGFLLQRAGAPPPDPLWGQLPPREVSFTLRVEEHFNARREGRISGIGKLLQTDIPHDTVSGNLASFYLESDELPAPGAVIEGQAVLAYLPAIEDPDGFQVYLKSRDIHLSLSRGTVFRKTRLPPPVEQLRQRLFRKCQQLLSAGCDEPGDPGNVLASMLLGNRTLLTDERVQTYRRSGTYHLFAVSGLHVGSVALCLHWLAGLVRLPVAGRLLVLLAGTWAYVWLTGSSPSAVRAGIMISCLGFARQLLRQPHLFPALVASAWLVLLIEPSQLYNLGFRLSYGVVGAIILVGLPLARELRNRLDKPRLDSSPRSAFRMRVRKSGLAACDLACISLSASLGSVPLIIEHFGLFTPAGMLLGILLNPIATLLVMTGCIAMLAAPLAGMTVAGWLPQATWPAISLMEFLIETALRLPGAASDRHWPWTGTGTLVLLLVLSLAWALQFLRQRGHKVPPATLLLPHAVLLTSLLMTQASA
jgi:competence protein ComEC